MRRLRILLALLGLGLVWAPPVAAQGTLAPDPYKQYINPSTGDLCSGCLLYTYASGTSTLLTTYSDSALTSPNTNPIVLNSAGTNPAGGVYLSPTGYKFALTTAGGTPIFTRDPVGAVPATSINLDIEGTAGEALIAGDVVYVSAGDGGRVSGRWYKADADNTYASSTAGMIGVATAAIASGSSGNIRLQGRVTGLSGLTVGAAHYASATAGALTASAPANARTIGVADSVSALLLAPNQAQPAGPFAVGGALTVGGSVTVTGGQILFPGTQVPAAGANTLDDYEENTWTPIIAGAGGTSGQAYTTQSGHYVKIGQLVFASFSVHVATEGTITGNARIQGLPFPAQVPSNGHAVAVQWRDLATNWVSVFCVVGVSSTTSCDLQGAGAAAVSAITALTATDVADGTRFFGTIVYRADQ